MLYGNSGALAAHLAATDDAQNRQITAEKQQLERSLEIGDYALDQQEELRQLDRYLEQLNYNEQDHALAAAKWSGGVGQKFGKSKKMPRGDKRF